MFEKIRKNLGRAKRKKGKEIKLALLNSEH